MLRHAPWGKETRVVTNFQFTIKVRDKWGGLFLKAVSQLESRLRFALVTLPKCIIIHVTDVRNSDILDSFMNHFRTFRQANVTIFFLSQFLE